MTDRDSIRRDAEYVLAFFGGPHVDRRITRLAQSTLELLDEPPYVPEGFALVKKPELKGKGVPAR